MRIAQVAPLYERVPPQFYGGTERVVSYLTEELVRQGHDVTLFASGDSITKAHLVPINDHSLRLDENSIDRLAHHMVQLEKVFAEIHNFDIVHFHIDYLHFPLTRRCQEPNVTTLHGRLDISDLQPLFREYHDMPVVSISNAQREPLPFANWVGNVYHGLPVDLLDFHPKAGDYLAFLGRISPEKRADRAIEIAKRTGIPLKIAAKVDDADKKYYEREIKPLLDHPLVEYIGEITEEQKNEFLGNALALLFPIDWAEPFGLVMIESMACGTPVIAFESGSVSEVLTEGVSGFLCHNLDEAVAAVGRLPEMDRAKVRAAFEERFTSTRMASDYVKVYQEVLAQRSQGREVLDFAELAPVVKGKRTSLKRIQAQETAIIPVDDTSAYLAE
ncbi:MAG TPA: glycosyltransferase family 4 protein [Chloroflexia bacterium]|nr:glycosyltransferase family 4 protein [Chloroflexia bacterium]